MTNISALSLKNKLSGEIFQFILLEVGLAGLCAGGATSGTPFAFSRENS
ncbi:hypothetical protein [Lewinella sp. LCG006]